jgi:hypothetical protein
LTAPCTSCSATDSTLLLLARRARVDAALALVRVVLAPAAAAVAVPFAPARAVLAVPAAAAPAVLAVVAADLAVDFAALAVLAAPDFAVVRVLVAPDLACVAVLAADLRALVPVDFAPVRAAARVLAAPVLREPEPEPELARVPPVRDDEDEVERPDDERLAGGIVKLLLLIDLVRFIANLPNVRALCAWRVQGFS